MVDDGSSPDRRTFFFRITVAVIIASWLIGWLIAFKNCYGWHFDDATEFSNLSNAPALVLLRPPYLYAYAWFIATVPIALHDVFHLGVPSLQMGDGTAALTAYFRLFMAWTLVVQLAIIVMLPFFLWRLLKNRSATILALLAFLLSPPLNFWAVNVDNRLLGMIAALPALWMLYCLLRMSGATSAALRLSFFAGLLLAIGQSIHYTCLYIGVPWTICIVILLAGRMPFRSVAAISGAFVAGVVLFFGVSEAIYRLVPGDAYPDPFLFLFEQNTRHIAHYAAATRLHLWLDTFVTLMGVPMMIAVCIGATLCFVRTIRPRWLSSDAALLVAGTPLLAVTYFLTTPAIGFYRQTSCLQICFGALAAIAIAWSTARLGTALRLTARTVLAVAIFWIPATQSFANYEGNQGLGRALAVAYAEPGHDRVTYIDYGVASSPLATSAGIGRIGTNDVLVTLMPSILQQNPSTLGILHEVKPAARFAGQQCTQEAYLEGAGLNAFRHYDEEPEMCEARVYLGRDILREIGAPKLTVSRLAADSDSGHGYTVENIVLQRIPGATMNTAWLSSQTAGAQLHHDVDVWFTRPATLQALTIVGPDYIGFGDRIDNMTITGASTPDGALHALWSGSELGHSPVFTATWSTQPLSHLRLDLWHSPDRFPWLVRPNYPTDTVGIRKIMVPGRTLVLASGAISDQRRP